VTYLELGFTALAVGSGNLPLKIILQWVSCQLQPEIYRPWEILPHWWLLHLLVSLEEVASQFFHSCPFTYNWCGNHHQHTLESTRTTSWASVSLLCIDTTRTNQQTLLYTNLAYINILDCRLNVGASPLQIDHCLEGPASVQVPVDQTISLLTRSC
jgi:hypothetical protein